MAEKVKENVVFGGGPVGIAVARSLRRRGESVTVVNRSGRTPEGLEDGGATVCAGDMMDAESVRTLTAGAARVFHCANPQYHQWADLLPVMQKNAVDAATENGAVLVLSENLYAYSGEAEYIDEETLLEPPTKKGRIRLELSRELEKAERERGLKWTAIRASDYYGPRSTYQSMFGTDRFLDMLAHGKNPSMIGALDKLHSYTYIEDFGEALVIAAMNEDAYGRAWICPNAPARTTGEIARCFIDAFQGSAGRRIQPRILPDIVLRAAGLFDPVIREIPEMLYQKRQTYVADGRLFTDLFGLVPTPFVDGIRRTLEWYSDRAGGGAAEPIL